MRNTNAKSIAEFLNEVINEDATLSEFNWVDIEVDNVIEEESKAEFRVTMDGKIFDISVKEI